VHNEEHRTLRRPAKQCIKWHARLVSSPHFVIAKKNASQKSARVVREPEEQWKPVHSIISHSPTTFAISPSLHCILLSHLPLSSSPIRQGKTTHTHSDRHFAKNKMEISSVYARSEKQRQKSKRESMWEWDFHVQNVPISDPRSPDRSMQNSKKNPFPSFFVGR